MRKKNTLLVFLATLMLFLPACSPSNPSQSQPVHLKVAILPIIDSLPLYVAEKEGLFNKHNVDVEFVPVASAPERDQLMAAGQVDGMINETLSTFQFNKEKNQVQVIRYALRPTETAGHFFILASAKSGITTVDQLKGVEIAVSDGTIIEYVTNRLLESNGFNADDISTISVPKMSDRSALLASGELKAAVLPDPLATLAIKQGAKVILSDAEYPEYGFSVYTFSSKTIKEHPGAIKSFLSSIEDAVTLINKNPARYGTLLSDKKVVPANLVNSYQIPTFPEADVPTKEEWKDALTWAQDKGLIGSDVDVSYTESVNPNYLPKP
jgi:NitT/TauT family transport system substrate-binding protein